MSIWLPAPSHADVGCLCLLTGILSNTVSGSYWLLLSCELLKGNTQPTSQAWVAGGRLKTIDTVITLSKLNLLGLPEILTGQMSVMSKTIARETFKISSTGRMEGRFIFPAAIREGGLFQDRAFHPFASIVTVWKINASLSLALASPMLLTFRRSRKMLTKNSQRETYLFSPTTGIWLFFQYYAATDSQTLFVLCVNIHTCLSEEKREYGYFSLPGSGFPVCCCWLVRHSLLCLLHSGSTAAR